MVHIEVQGQTKRNDRCLFGERMFRYFYRCYDKYRKPIAAIAIFCGPDGKKLPGKFEYEFLNTRLEYQYNRLCILDYSDKELAESRNPFAWVVLAAKNALLKGKHLDERLLQGKLFVFRKLYENGVFEKQKLQAILTFLKNYVRFEDSDLIHIFNKEVDKITGKENTMDIFEQVAEMRWEEGKEEGLKEGRAAEKERSVRLFLASTDFSVEKIAELHKVRVSYVKKLSKEVRGK